VNSSVLKHLFLERVEQPKISPKKPGKAFSDALLISCFQNFAAVAANKKTAFGAKDSEKLFYSLQHLHTTLASFVSKKLY